MSSKVTFAIWPPADIGDTIDAHAELIEVGCKLPDLLAGGLPEDVKIDEGMC